MRRLAGKFAVFLAGVYLLVVFAAMVDAYSHRDIPVWEWPLLALPALAFAPSVLDAFRLHRTSDTARMKALWPRCLALAGIGTVLLIAIAVLVERMTLR
jgi:hypothetical protein